MASDDLRTRIAEVLPSIFDRIADGDFVEWDDMADAVIRELGLRLEQCPCSQRGPNCATRYVTDWRPADCSSGPLSCTPDTYRKPV